MEFKIAFFKKSSKVGNAFDRVSKNDIINTGLRITKTYSIEEAEKYVLDFEKSPDMNRKVTKR